MQYDDFTFPKQHDMIKKSLQEERLWDIKKPGPARSAAS